MSERIAEALKAMHVTIERKLSELELAPIGGDQFTPSTDAELRALESAIGMVLPSDYREFSSTYGACDFDVDCRFPTHAGGVFPGYFLSANEILKSLEFVGDVLPSYVIPINDDGGGNYICISVGYDSQGHVYFRNHGIGWDHDAEDSDKAKMDTLFQLSTSFTDFILSLQRDD